MIIISELDNQLEEKWEYDWGKQDYLLSLLNESVFEGRLKDKIERDINEDMNQETYDKIVFNLFSNQLDRISAGLPYSATDIIKHLRRFM